ncbi:MAG: GTPase Era [Candidatus Eisenbacteria bacterium]|nr:GTPase Era [Candidatus Eisenbacteria bacterium]
MTAANGPGSGHRSGYVAIAGAPNAGKSTLLNALVQARLAAVTPKPQTSRRRTLGIMSGASYQMILLDTPGVLRPRNPMEEAMEKVIHQALADADVILYLVDGAQPRFVPEVEEAAARKPTIAVLNKVDRLRSRELLLPVIDELRRRAPIAEFVPISALQRTNLELLINTLVSHLPEGPVFYPPDQLTEQPERFFVAELIREQIFLQFRREVPYGAEVLIEEFRERPGRKDLIQAAVIVESDSQKAILIGKGGREIKRLGSEARRTIEEFLGREVFLDLRVKTVSKWRKKPEMLRRLGYS